MAKYNYTTSYTAQAKKPLTKEEIRKKQERRLRAERRRRMKGLHDSAVLNMRERQRMLSGESYDDEYSVSNNSNTYNNYYGQPVSSVDKGILADLQNMKFCRKPIGFLMNLVFLVSIALIVISFLSLNIPMVNKFTALYMDGVPRVSEEETTGEADTNTEGDANQAENASSSKILAAEDDAAQTETEEATDGEEKAAEEDPNTYYKFSDPIFGWISYISNMVNYDLTLGESPWYDSQIMKVQTGMHDNLAAILIQAFPAAILLYVIFGLTLCIKTFVCWASGDRRIYRNTWVECFIMILLALVTAMGGFASTVDIDGSMDFGAIVNYLIGAVTGVGGFTAGFGLLIMVGLPLVGMLLSFFLLEKKLRSREITQPIIMYEYKEARRASRR